jgi:hypothetical protein
VQDPNTKCAEEANVKAFIVDVRLEASETEGFAQRIDLMSIVYMI